MTRSRKAENPSEPDQEITWPSLEKNLLEHSHLRVLKERSSNTAQYKKAHSEYLKWLRGFLKKEILYGGTPLQEAKGLQQALLQIARISPGLINEIIQACYCAARYNTKSDPGPVRRQRARDFKQDISPQLTAIKTLCKYWKQYPDTTNMALAQAYLGLKSKFKAKDSHYLYYEGQYLNYHQLLQSLLEEFSQVLKGGKILGQMGDNFLPQFQIGPLLYSTSLEGQHAQPQARENGLFFHLTLLFRLATDRADPPQHILQAGLPMPRNGKPHYPLVAVLAEATLGKNFSASQVQKRIRDLIKNKVEWLGWPSS